MMTLSLIHLASAFKRPDKFLTASHFAIIQTSCYWFLSQAFSMCVIASSLESEAA